MKCPHCGKELAISKKDSSYGLCHTCKKRYKLPSQQQTYSNIPPKHIREKSERTIRENYRNMLEIEDEEDVSETRDKVSKKDCSIYYFDACNPFYSCVPTKVHCSFLNFYTQLRNGQNL